MYSKLKVYERSYKAGLAIYELTKEYPEEEKYGIVSQMRRASTSIPLNIAEGYAKKSSQEEFKRFLLMSIGSANEQEDVPREMCLAGMNAARLNFSHGTHEKKQETPT